MKNLTLKVALVAVATFAGLNGFAQVTNTGSDATTGWPSAGKSAIGKYSRSAASPLTDPLAPAVTTPVDSITINKVMPFFVWPSAAYNPTWNPSAVYTNPSYPTPGELVKNVVSKFAWASAGGSIVNYYNDGTTTVNAAGIKNYVEISYNTTGIKLIEVQETPLSGICPGDKVYFGVNVINPPAASFTLSATPALYGLDSILVSACETDASLTTAIGKISANDAYPFWINLGFKVYNVTGLDISGNIDLTTTGANPPATDITDLGVGFPNRIVKGSVDGTLTPSATNPIIVNSKTAPIVASQAYDVRNSMITVYEFSYQGLSGRISRKSDYIAARAGAWTATSYDKFSMYDLATPTTIEKYYIIAFPKPVTGPIYHIANNFAY